MDAPALNTSPQSRSADSRVGETQTCSVRNPLSILVCPLSNVADMVALRESLLVHCRAGIGRSTAAAFIAGCAAHPATDEHEIAVALRQASPRARPYKVLVRLADQEMGREGRMHQAIASTGRGLPPIEVAESGPFQFSLPGPRRP